MEQNVWLQSVMLLKKKSNECWHTQNLLHRGREPFSVVLKLQRVLGRLRFTLPLKSQGILEGKVHQTRAADLKKPHMTESAC